MPGVCCLHGVHGERADRVRHLANGGLCAGPRRRIVSEVGHYGLFFYDERRLSSTSRWIMGVRISCIARSSFPPGMTIEFARLMKLSPIMRLEVGEVDPARVFEPDDHHQFIGGRYPAGREGVRRVDRRHALEVDVGLAELRADVVDIIRHAAKDGFRDILGRVSAGGPVTMKLLRPFEIDHGHDADLQVRVAGDIDLVRDNSAVQPFVEEECRFLPASLPTP